MGDGDFTFPCRANKLFWGEKIYKTFNYAEYASIDLFSFRCVKWCDRFIPALAPRLNRSKHQLNKSNGSLLSEEVMD